MGSQSDNEKAYIAGFLDGDGSIMLQLKRRSDTKRAYRFMATICFYQDSRHDLPLAWIRNVLGAGYIAKRNDAMSELRINGFRTIRRILGELEPFIRFKRLQVEAMMAACDILSGNGYTKLSKQNLLDVVELMLIIQTENYTAHRKKTREELLTLIGLTP